jgi:hypothetical protein
MLRTVFAFTVAVAVAILPTLLLCVSVFVQLSLWGGYLEHGVHASIVARV